MNSASSVESKAGRVRLPPEWDRLELAVRRLLDEHAAARRRLDQSRRRVAELEDTVRQVASGVIDPAALTARLDALEEENRALRERLAQAHGIVARIMARLRFIEEER